MIHIYTGDGKGKTTAALGLALRWIGGGKNAYIYRFLKGRHSCELASLDMFDNIAVKSLSRDYGFYKAMSADEREAVYVQHNAFLTDALRRAEDMIVLDEVIAAYNYGALDKSLLDEVLFTLPAAEIVMTGRNAPPELVAAADYVSEIRKIKHPFDSGAAARRGVEM